MADKHILFRQEAREQLLAGVNATTRAVRVTLGPRGRNVLIDKSWGSPTVTKDGVSVAKEVELPDKFQNMGAQIAKEAASRTSDLAGDGTTTATVLTAAILRAGHKLVAAGHNPSDLRRGIEKAVRAVVEDLAKRSSPAREAEAIVQVGTISANGDESIGRLLGEAMEKVGKDGVITVEEAQSIDSSLEVVEGMQLDRGYISPYFATDSESMETVLEDALVLIHEKPIHALRELLPLLQEVAQSKRPLLIVAEDVGGDALTALVVNKVRGSLACAAIKAPGFGAQRREMLEDLAILTGAQVFSADLGLKLENAELEQLGSAKRIAIDKEHTTLIGGRGSKDAIAARCQQLRHQIENAASDFDREKLQERLARLSGGVAIIRVGAATESEMKEKKARVEDALHATRAAVEEGIVPGGGVALLRAQEALTGLAAALSVHERPGVAIVRRALEEPLRLIAENAGFEGAVVVDKVRELRGSVGFNARSEKYEDLVKCGVIDPTKVVRAALQNAASVSALLLTAEVMIATQAN